MFGQVGDVTVGSVCPNDLQVRHSAVSVVILNDNNNQGEGQALRVLLNRSGSVWDAFAKEAMIQRALGSRWVERGIRICGYVAGEFTRSGWGGRGAMPADVSYGIMDIGRRWLGGMMAYALQLLRGQMKAYALLLILLVVLGGLMVYPLVQEIAAAFVDRGKVSLFWIWDALGDGTFRSQLWTSLSAWG